MMKKILVLLSYIISVVINSLANIIPFNNLSTKEISERYGDLLAPDSRAFIIWGAIYLALLIFTIYQFKLDDSSKYDKLRNLAIIVNLLNAVWMFTWHYEIIYLSFIIISAMMYILVKIDELSFKEKNKYFIKYPFSIYLGWIIIATTLNFYSMLDYFNVGFIGSTYFLVFYLIISSLISIYLSLRLRNYLVNVIALYAFSFLGIKYADEFNNLAVLLTIITLIVLNFLTLILNRKKENSNCLN